MSGFGTGGFGSPPPFGSQPPPSSSSSQQPQFGGGFGATATPTAPGFGTAPATTSFGGGGTSFGSTSTQTFGANTNPAPTTAFGSSATTAAFGQSTSFGTPSAAAAPSTLFGFGASTTTAAPFGANTPPPPQQQPGFGSAPFGGTPAPSSGATTTTTTFGAPVSIAHASTTTSSGFGTPVALGAPSSTSAAAPPNPFAGSAAAAPAVSFGASSNVAPTTTTTTASFAGAPGFGTSGFGSSSTTPTMGTFNNNAPSSGFPATSGFGSSATTASTSFAAPAPPSSGFGAPAAATSSSLGFGASTTTATFPSAPAFSGTTTSDNNMMGDEPQDSRTATGFGSSAAFFAASTSTWPTSSASSTQPTGAEGSGGGGMADAAMSKSGGDDNEARLRAKIDAKKKKLQELKQRKEAAAAKQQQQQAAEMEQTTGVTTPPPSSSSLNAGATAFVPSGTPSTTTAAATSVGGPWGDKTDPSASRRSAKTTDNDQAANQASLAERNALRFATSVKSAVPLPADLQNRAVAPEKRVTLGPNEADDDDDMTRHLSSAVSLVGTCQFMCPDDELLKRQQESDIQLLETPQPGTIHPQEWTLRNTAVKRFRRSAADYKLDVPEWVRPPEVLETVCGYLEEWVMERDRQGPDSRFAHAPSPPPLDVYQFIWDRTRMVRKDFILQNYVGTGGHCDARAVRCHERIARWHAMCEHQLSHIDDFAIKQSQQNIQELGQTMKTLNQYYDDSMGRSVVEVPDETGRETITNFANRRHGCGSDFVMGVNPVDFNGSTLSNDPNTTSVANRLIGQHPESPSHGTAEPEMRGLYILLTMNNDGGMEVLKYASYLFSKRPEVYHSAPVQLALRIFKAKKEYNYARFFSILRSPSTPYLFACIMFKHVEQMRKIAFRIMSKSYGARRKDTGEAVYDAYPLRKLVKLLCFEEEDEARAACEHYNITVRPIEVASSSSPTGKVAVAVVLWRHSTFKEAKDPEKGFVLPCRPKKMVRTIESKLHGATRLAVCRGEVSGEGASLAKPVVSRHAVAAAAPIRQEVTATAVPRQEEMTAMSTAKTEEQRQREAQAREEAAKQAAEEEAKRRMEEKRRLREEQKRKAEEKRRLEEMEKKRREEERVRALELQKKREIELARQKAEEERKKKEALEAARRAAAAAAAEKERLRVEEEKRLAAAAEAAKRKAEEEERERKRQEELLRKRQEEERKERLRLEEEARKQREAEELRLRLLEEKRRKEEEERRRKEAEARRIELEWEKKAKAARKLLLWRRLLRRRARALQAEKARATLSSIDPTFSSGPSILSKVYQEVVTTDDTSTAGSLIVASEREPLGLALFRQIIREDTVPLNLSVMLEQELAAHTGTVAERLPAGAIILKVAVILPDFEGPLADSVSELIHGWVDRRLRYGKVVTGASSFDIRTVAVRGHSRRACRDCDAALFVCPPPFGLDNNFSFPDVGLGIPLVVLDLDDGRNLDHSNRVASAISGVNSPVVDTVRNGIHYDDALATSCSILLRSFADKVIDGSVRSAITEEPLSHLADACIRAVLWRDVFHHGSSEEDQILRRMRSVVATLADVLQAFADEHEEDATWNWPSPEFIEGSVVPNFYADKVGLPVQWKKSLYRSTVAPALSSLYKSLGGSLTEVLDDFLLDAPPAVTKTCRAMMSKSQYRRCLEYVLMWREKAAPSAGWQPVVYLPRRDVSVVVDRCIQQLYPASDDALRPIEWDDSIELLEEEHDKGVSSPVVTPRDSLLAIVPQVSVVPASTANTPFSNENYKTPASRTRQQVLDTPPTATTPAGVETPFTTPAGVQTPQTLPTAPSSMKRARFQMQEDNAPQQHDSKRKRGHVVVSTTTKESTAFTKKLEALLHGKSTIDCKVGDSSISKLLRGAPAIQLPESLP